MLLSDVAHVGKLNVVQDGEFRHLAKLNTLSPVGGNLIFIEDIKYARDVDPTLVSCVITRVDLVDTLLSQSPGIGVAASEQPRESFYKIHHYLLDSGFYFAKKPTYVHPSAVIAPGVKIAPHNVRIGANTVLEDGVIIKENVVIGNNCLIQSGTIIGNDCFEVTTIDGVQTLVRHAGQVIIGNNCVIQSNCTISRGLFPSRNTVIGEEVIIADLVHIAHGVHIGHKTRIAAGVVVAGNVEVGENVWIGPSAVISNNIVVEDKAYISIGAVVVRNVKAGEKVAGNFAIEYRTLLKTLGRALLDE